MTVPPFQIKHKLGDMFNTGSSRGETHKEAVLEEAAILEEAVCALNEGWSAVQCVRVVGKNHTEEEEEDENGEDEDDSSR